MNNNRINTQSLFYNTNNSTNTNINNNHNNNYNYKSTPGFHIHNSGSTFENSMQK
jgi:hypothetical protein